jgi:HSP20 family molecular chaperone IbpA
MARISFERRDDPGDPSVRRFFELLEDGAPEGQGECTPPVDVVEHGDRVYVIVDLPGVPAASVRVIFSRGTLVVAGRKAPRVCERSVAFHLAERGFGRFVRAIGLSGAFDGGNAAATLTGGELCVVLPRIAERRGGDIFIEVNAR